MLPSKDIESLVGMRSGPRFDLTSAFIEQHFKDKYPDYSFYVFVAARADVPDGRVVGISVGKDGEEIIDIKHETTAPSLEIRLLAQKLAFILD